MTPTDKLHSAGRVVHCKRELYDVYIGRPSQFGNPFTFEDERDRDEAIAKFENYARQHMKDHHGFRDAVRDLHGKVLGCWCAPKPCHGDVLLKLAAELNIPSTTRNANGDGYSAAPSQVSDPARREAEGLARNPDKNRPQEEMPAVSSLSGDVGVAILQWKERLIAQVEQWDGRKAHGLSLKKLYELAVDAEVLINRLWNERHAHSPTRQITTPPMGHGPAASAGASLRTGQAGEVPASDAPPQELPAVNSASRQASEALPRATKLDGDDPHESAPTEPREPVRDSAQQPAGVASSSTKHGSLYEAWPHSVMEYDGAFKCSCGRTWGALTKPTGMCEGCARDAQSSTKRICSRGGECVIDQCHRCGAIYDLAPSANALPRNMALVCATCRLTVPDNGERFCDAGEACPHRVQPEGRSKVGYMGDVNGPGCDPDVP
jgi:hypothetical protein